MKFITIKAAERKIDFFDGQHPYNDLEAAIGVDPMRTDHGTVVWGLGIIVYELGLLEPEHQDFFAIGKHLYQGNALIYRFDEAGETVDVTNIDLKLIHQHLIFITGRDTVEQLIQEGTISRPQSSVNGEVFWEWKP